MATPKNGNGKSFQDLKCIWMSSNVIDYRLCDQNFECENCQFDKVIRNFTGEKKVTASVNEELTNPIDEVINKIKNQAYEAKNIYLKNQMVVKHLFANTYYIGLNPITMFFLDGIEEIIDGGHEGYVRRNQALFKLQGEWGYITITSPMNFTLLDKLTMRPDDLLKSKWFAIIGAAQPEITTSKLSREQWQMNQINSIRLLNDIKTNYPSIGSTMMDGGIPVRTLNKVVGNAEYLKILSKLFNE